MPHQGAHANLVDLAAQLGGTVALPHELYHRHGARVPLGETTDMLGPARADKGLTEIRLGAEGAGGPRHLDAAGQAECVPELCARAVKSPVLAHRSERRDLGGRQRRKHEREPTVHPCAS